MERLGIDAIIAEGTESGGHVGDTTTFSLLPQVIDAVKVPVIAAGGIADGRGLVAAMAFGASGIQIGTRFVCSEECVAHAKFKERVITAHDRATVVIGKTIAHPTRCLENKMTYQYLSEEKAGASNETLESITSGGLLRGTIEGDMDTGVLMIGQIAGLIKDIKPVKKIIEDIMSEAEAVINGIILASR